MLHKEVLGLQLAPTKWLYPNRHTSGSIATHTVITRASQISYFSSLTFAFTYKKIKTKPNWEDRVLAISKWKNLAGQPFGSVFQRKTWNFCNNREVFVERF